MFTLELLRGYGAVEPAENVVAFTVLAGAEMELFAVGKWSSPQSHGPVPM